MDLCLRSRQAGLIGAAVVPRLRRGRWIRQVDSVVQLKGNAFEKSEAWHVLEEAVGEEVLQFAAARPPIALATDDPPPPNCCVYQDFARGTAEVAWSGPALSTVAAPLPFAAVLLPEEEDFALAHARGTGQTTVSLRLDYNFMCISAARRTKIGVVGLGGSLE
jgi:hypothetical protein